MKTAFGVAWTNFVCPCPFHSNLNEEMEVALERKSGDREAVSEIPSKQKAMLMQRQSALGDIEFRYKMSAGMSLVTNYPCYVSKAGAPSAMQPSGYDLYMEPALQAFGDIPDVQFDRNN